MPPRDGGRKTQARGRKMSENYGQVYRVGMGGRSGFEVHGAAWAGTLWAYGTSGGKSVWEDKPQPTPKSAFKRMELAAKQYEITDLRKWSGDLSEHGGTK